MNFNQLSHEILKTGTDREWLLAASGLPNRWLLYEKGVAGVALIDATAEEVINHVKQNLH